MCSISSNLLNKSHIMEVARVALLLFSLCLLVMRLSSAILKEDHGNEKSRVFNKELSDIDHHLDDDDEDEHNIEYDHEAFLGREDAHSFDELTPEESKLRLGNIYDKIDVNVDGLVDEGELQEWIGKVQNHYVVEDTERQWTDLGLSDATGVKWTEYESAHYGVIEDREEYDDMMRRDERKWKLADVNGNGELDKMEFGHFLHPEEVPHMRDIVIEETLEDIDTDNDGKISLDEYVADMWPGSDDDDEPEPEWVVDERLQFTKFRDTDGDGYMDRKEVEAWILPQDYDHTLAEAKHLIHEADSGESKDGMLTKEEVLNKYDVFVGSQATDYGEALTRHDEF